MELRKRKTNFSYINNNLNISQESLNNKSDSEKLSLLTQKNESIKLSNKKNNKRKKLNSDSEYEYSSSNNNEFEDIIGTDDSRVSSTKGGKKKRKKKYKIYNNDSDYDSDGSKEDVITNSAYDPIIQQNVTLVTPLRTMKKIKFNNMMNEIIDLVGDSDEDIEAIAIIESDDDIDCQQKPYVQKDEKEKKVDIVIDLCLNNDDNDEEISKSYEKNNILNSNKSNTSSRKSSDEETEETDEEINIVSPFKKRNRFDKKKIIDDDDITDENIININYKRKKSSKINSDDEDYNDDDTESEYFIKSHKNEQKEASHFLRSRSKNSINTITNEEKKNKNEKNYESKKELEINSISLKGKNINNKTINKNESISPSSNFLIELESLSFDDQPSGSIKISSGDSSDDDIVEIISSKKINDEIEISDDDEHTFESQKRRKSLNSLPQSSMKKSIEQRLSRKKKKDQNRLLDFQRLKERKRKPIDSINPYEDVIGNDSYDNYNDKNIISPLRFFDRNDDFIVSDTGDEPVYFLTTEWDVKQRKKLYKAFKTLFRFCIGIIIGGNFMNKNLDNLKKAFQIINKRINYVCKKITPVPPWIPKFQNHVDSYPYMSVISQYPLSKCDSCNKDITSSFAVSFSGKKYNKLSLREMNNDVLKDKEIVFVIDRVCLERVQIYHELYHFKYNTLKNIEKKMKEEGININKLKKSTDENKIENTFLQLKNYCKELYVRLAEKLKHGENYIPNTLDI